MAKQKKFKKNKMEIRDLLENIAQRVSKKESYGDLYSEELRKDIQDEINKAKFQEFVKIINISELQKEDISDDQNIEEIVNNARREPFLLLFDFKNKDNITLGTAPDYFGTINYTVKNKQYESSSVIFTIFNNAKYEGKYELNVSHDHTFQTEHVIHENSYQWHNPFKFKYYKNTKEETVPIKMRLNNKFTEFNITIHNNDHYKSSLEIVKSHGITLDSEGRFGLSSLICRESIFISVSKNLFQKDSQLEYITFKGNTIINFKDNTEKGRLFYRSLQTLQKEKGDVIGEHLAYAQELDIYKKGLDWNYSDKWILFFGDIISNHRQNIILIIFWIFTVALVFSYIYSTGIFECKDELGFFTSSPYNFNILEQNLKLEGCSSDYHGIDVFRRLIMAGLFYEFVVTMRRFVKK